MEMGCTILEAGPLTLFQIFKDFSNYQIDSNLKIMKRVFSGSKNFQTLDGCIKFHKEQISFLAHLQNPSEF
jgi:hypothetical protein